MCALPDTSGHLLPSTVKSFIPQRRGVSVGADCTEDESG